jgi:hypothetical protein
MGADVATRKRVDIKQCDWVACSVREYGPAGAHRHLIRKAARKLNYQTTLCSTSANMPGIWRANRTKPECPACLARVNDSADATG